MKNLYSYKNKMPENDQNLGWSIGISDLDAIDLDDKSLEGLDVNWVLGAVDSLEWWENVVQSTENLVSETSISSNAVDESVFLDTWDDSQFKKNVSKDEDNFWTYLRRFFFSSILTLIGVFAIFVFYLFQTYIRESTSLNPDSKKQEYVDMWKDAFKWVKELVWNSNSYTAPDIWSPDEVTKVNEIINANDIDYIEKKEILSSYVSDLVRGAEDKTVYIENLRQSIAKQWFLPEELGILLSEDQAISTIQRSLSALEVIKFSTATRVFMYMNTALSTIAEMIRVRWANVENLRNLFEALDWRWEKDISSYVYMCYLNPFEVSANCDAIWDFDLYYKIAKDDSIDIVLFKNAMNAISQLLEKWDTTLFSITFNWFNAADKNIQFNVEVYTTQEDERALMAQWKKNPNIFILTNIINLLKQSSFILGADINTKEINVNTRMLNQWWISRPVNYSTMDFTVPIQKNTEREIFDYIDLDSMKKLLSDRWFKENPENEESINLNEENDVEDLSLEMGEEEDESEKTENEEGEAEDYELESMDE